MKLYCMGKFWWHGEIQMLYKYCFENEITRIEIEFNESTHSDGIESV